jgi:hypothetical protein
MHLRLAWSTLLCCVMACDSATSDRLGASCESDHACDALVCAADWEHAAADLDPMPLHCAEPQGTHDLGDACEHAEQCDRGLCLLAGACAQACRDHHDCSTGQRCQSVYARVDDGRLATASACVDHVNLPRDSRVQSQELPAAVSGGTDVLALPPHGSQTLHVIEHLDDTSWPVPANLSRCRPPLCALELRTSEKEVLFARDQLSENAQGPANPIAQGSHVNPLPVWIPNGTRITAEPRGRGYELEVESSQKGAVRITSLTRAERGLRLDLNLFYVGAAELAPEGTRGPPLLEAALEEVERIFEPADIFLGEVRQLSVPGMLAERGSEAAQGDPGAGFALLLSRYQVLPEFPELLRLSAGAANSALDVFFVADIQSTIGADVGGIAGGTPVAFGMHGGPGSGIAIASDMYVVPGRARELGRTLAHEIGHALGLFHTTEPNGVVFDPLADTPACPLARDSDKSGSLDAEECAADGGDNLMFSTSDAGDRLSDEQCEVLRRALILQ